MNEPAQGKTLGILVVEDDLLLREVLQLQLRVAGFSVRAASTGEEALAMVRQSQPEVLLLDLGLPDMSGLEVLAKLWEEQPSTKSMPVIIHTSSDPSKEDASRLSAGRPVTWITKTRACTDNLCELIRTCVKKDTAIVESR